MSFPNGKVSTKEGPCIVCGCTAHPRGFEDAHIYAAGVRGAGKDSGGGCDCSINILRLCWECHRQLVHGVNGGWEAAIAKAYKAGLTHLSKLVTALAAAEIHYLARLKGETECTKNSKVAWLARARQRSAP